MKIAILSPIAWRTPPEKYGPWEQVASNIAEGLIEKNIEVTVFATGNSITKGKLESVTRDGYAENTEIDPKVWECLHIANLMEQADQFDLIHNNFDFLPLTYSRLIKTPMLTTIHGFSSPSILPVYKKYNKDNYYVSISNFDRSSDLEYMATIYNGLNTGQFTYQETPKDYLLFFGRIHPDKGTYESIQIAKKSGRKLIISGLIQNQEYFDSKIKPFVNGDDIVYVGNSESIARDKLLGEAFALLHPISFHEPFGLSVAESMMCGTPVIAFNMGSMPELIINGKTGYLVDTIDEAAEAVNQVQEIIRINCRDWALSKFSREKMVESYFQIYEEIIR
ncbi:MAG: glycosyltransferase family 4 protein [Leptospira sp.]|nr:glycosyltransferase family 4 protein [Leptospira sp.]